MSQKPASIIEVIIEEIGFYGVSINPYGDKQI
jgi:hypothetical protein